MLGVGEGDKNDTWAGKWAHSKLGYDWRSRANRSVNFTLRFFTEHIKRILLSLRPIAQPIAEILFNEALFHIFHAVPMIRFFDARILSPQKEAPFLMRIRGWRFERKHNPSNRKLEKFESSQNLFLLKSVHRGTSLLLQQSCCSYPACTSCTPTSMRETELTAKIKDKK